MLITIIIFAIPLIVFVITKKARLTLIISSPIGTGILWINMLYLEAHAIDSDFDIVFSISMLFWAILLNLIYTAEILLMKLVK
jgi:hypothetical protein